MAGTDNSQDGSIAAGPRMVLARPQLGENIGASARAMLNCGLTDMALVAPRDKWPNERAVAMSSGATVVLDNAVVHDDLTAAIADLHHVYATTARGRDLTKRVVTPRAAAMEMRAAVARGEGVGVIFGPERTGLTNDDVALAQTVIHVPLNPSYASLNLAQAVLLVGYEWFQAGVEGAAEELVLAGTRPATREEVVNFTDRLEGALDDTGFFHVPEMRPSIARNLHNLFQRLPLTEQEVRTLQGVVSSLIKGPKTR